MIIKKAHQTREEALEEANRYKNIRHFLEEGCHEYRTTPMSLEEALAEAKKGKEVEGVLQDIKVVRYTKKAQPKLDIARAEDMGTGQVEKVAFYSVAQKGEIKPADFEEPSEKRQVVRGMIQKVANLHRQALCHHDIKGANFLWNRIRGRIVVHVIDVAMLDAMAKPENYTIGSLAYTPPEILAKFVPKNKQPGEQASLSQSELNKAKDSFALGMAIVRDVYGFDMKLADLRKYWKENPSKFLPLLSQYGIDPEDVTKFLQNPKSMKMEPRNRIAFVCLLQCVVINDYLSRDLLKIDSSMKEVIAGLLNLDPEKRISAEDAAQLLEITLVKDQKATPA